MRRFPIVLAVALASASTSLTIATGPAGASDRTLFVSHTAIANGKDRNCATAAYASVQSAIYAAREGSQVYLCGTTPFVESVVIQDKQVDLAGDPGAIIQAPANATVPTTFFSSQGLQTPNSVVTVIGQGNVRIDGLTIEGPFQNTSCVGDDYGVLQIASDKLKLTNDKILNIEAADQAGLGGCQYGVGIEIGREYWPNLNGANGGYNVVNFEGNAQIRNSTVSGYQKNGITADGPGTNIEVQSSSIDGGGQTNVIARNGIQISRGATGQVLDSAINNNEYTGTGSFASATGVLVFGGCGDPLSTNVQVHENMLLNNDSGVVLANYTSDPNCVASATSPTNNEVHDNTITKNDGETNHSPFTDQSGNNYTGYQVGVGDTGDNDQIHGNVIIGTIVGGFDTAFGPLTTPGGNFLVPIDIETYPPIHSRTHDNTYDGKKINAPNQ